MGKFIASDLVNHILVYNPLVPNIFRLFWSYFDCVWCPNQLLFYDFSYFSLLLFSNFCQFRGFTAKFHLYCIFFYWTEVNCLLFPFCARFFRFSFIRIQLLIFFLIHRIAQIACCMYLRQSFITIQLLSGERTEFMCFLP